MTKKTIFVEKADWIIKKDTERNEITRKKKTWKLVLRNINESSEKAIEVNNEFRVNFDDQQDDVNPTSVKKLLLKRKNK